MIEIKRILLPTDFTELAAYAAVYAKVLAHAQGAEIHVLHVVVPSNVAGTVSVAGDLGATMLLPETSAVAEAQVSRVKAFADEFMRESGMPVFTAIRVGDAPHTIAQYAQDMKIDLIVVGSHARGLVNRIFFGSTSKAVLESAPCPVLMVPLKSMPRSTIEYGGEDTKFAS